MPKACMSQGDLQLSVDNIIDRSFLRCRPQPKQEICNTLGILYLKFAHEAETR